MRSDNLGVEGLTDNFVSSSIEAAAQTWDGKTREDLFLNVEISNAYSESVDRADDKIVHAWKPIDGTALGYSRTWYTKASRITAANGKSYWEAIDSDICYNTNREWSTSLAPGTIYGTGDGQTTVIDVRTVALHELGHTFGLGDLYKTQYSRDYSQIMTYYNDVLHTIGAGDENGIQQLYGKPT